MKNIISKITGSPNKISFGVKKYLSGFLLVLLVLVGLTVANYVGAGPTTKTINSVLLNNATAVSVTSGSSITTTVSVRTGSGDNDKWRSTKYQIGTSTTPCVDTTDIGTSNTTGTTTFSITAPVNVGSYDVKIWIYSNNTCSDNQTGPTLLTNGITVTVLTNTPRCR